MHPQTKLLSQFVVVVVVVIVAVVVAVVAVVLVVGVVVVVVAIHSGFKSPRNDDEFELI